MHRVKRWLSPCFTVTFTSSLPVIYIMTRSTTRFIVVQDVKSVGPMNLRPVICRLTAYSTHPAACFTSDVGYSLVTNSVVWSSEYFAVMPSACAANFTFLRDILMTAAFAPGLTLKLIRQVLTTLKAVIVTYASRLTFLTARHRGPSHTPRRRPPAVSRGCRHRRRRHPTSHRGRESTHCSNKCPSGIFTPAPP